MAFPSEQSGAVLIGRKLAPPPAPEPFLSRPRLEQLIATLIEEHRVVVVAATPGAGKTTAVAEAARLADRPLAWLSVDRSDTAPGRLLTYLEASLARQLPQLEGVATKALAAGVPYAEAAGLLAEAVGDAPLLFVLDDLERLGEAKAAWTVLEALVRYASANLRLTLISRRAIPTTLCELPAWPACATLTEGQLAFTATEAAAALGMLGEHGRDAQAVVEATGGWVTGVLFEAWRSDEHAAALGGEADPLDGYLSSHIVDQLDSPDRDFLVVTSVLDEVSVARATALGQTEPGDRLAALRAARLPVVWGEGGRTMRCHPRFREYLLHRLERQGADEVAALRVAHARLLAAEGHDEEATEEFMLAGAPAEALATAENAIFAVIERLDFAVAERWLSALADLASSGTTRLTTAELLLALATDDYGRGVRIADRLSELGERDKLARSSDRAAALLAAMYIGVGRLADVRGVLSAAPDGPAVGVVRYVLRLYEQVPEHPRPELSGGDMDGGLHYADYFHGRLAELVEAPVSRWVNAVALPWQIAALSALGRTREAVHLYEAAHDAGVAPVSLGAYVGPEVLIDAGRREQAREAIERGRNLAAASGARDLQLINGLMEAKLALRLDHDPVAAIAILDRVEREPAAHRWPFISGPLNTWRGVAALLQGDDATALRSLRQAVEVMVASDMILELPTAAAYLAEAEWRADDEEAADRAADVALDASRRLGSNHRLLQALVDFPAVVSRRIDAEPAADSPWHELGRALIAQGVTVPTRIGDSVQLQEFGTLALVVNGADARPRITKSYELLAFLIARPRGAVERDELLDALFDGRSDDSTRSYLRNAVYWVRRVLPDNSLVVVGGKVELAEDLAITSESVRFEAQLAEAARLRGEERLAATIEALAVFDGGDYLPGAASAWADDRRLHLAERARDARYEAAELAFSAADYQEAGELAEQVLREDPLREAAWRLSMRVANALGDDDRAIAAFHGCEQALARIGTTPSASTRELLQALRR